MIIMKIQLYYVLGIFVVINMIRNIIIVTKMSQIHYSSPFMYHSIAIQFLYAVTALANDYLAISFKFLNYIMLYAVF